MPHARNFFGTANSEYPLALYATSLFSSWSILEHCGIVSLFLFQEGSSIEAYLVILLQSSWVTMLPGTVASIYTASSSRPHYLRPGMPLDPVDHINPGDDVQAFPACLQAKCPPKNHVGRCHAGGLMG